jgi:hypothetical protein
MDLRTNLASMVWGSLQEGASFNLEAVKVKIEAARAAMGK